MTRDDLLGINLKIIKKLPKELKIIHQILLLYVSPNFRCNSNGTKYSGLPHNMVVGMAGILDSSRFKYFLSKQLDIPVNKINSLVLGGHGDTMVLWNKQKLMVFLYQNF